MLIAFILADSNPVLSEYGIFSETPFEKKRRIKKMEREDSLFKRNCSENFGAPEEPLTPNRVLDDLLSDRNRNYIGKITHLHAWQFFLLADKIKPLIERPRLRRDGTRPDTLKKQCQHDHFHRLYFCLFWMNNGLYYRTAEAIAGWGKSSLQEDNIHILIAINEGLEDQVAWPDAARRAELASVHTGIFSGMVGIFDVREHECKKYKDPEKERKTWSGKKKLNSWKNMSVMDYSGRYLYVHVALAKNDRDMFTASPLYMNEGEYFSAGQWLASDGGFEGDGPVRYSYKNPGADEDKKLFNLAFREVRTGIETSFARVCAWFPILGNNKRKWNHGDDVMQLSIHAASKLHNWIMNTENLSYSALTSAENHFRPYY